METLHDQHAKKRLPVRSGSHLTKHLMKPANRSVLREPFPQAV